MPQLPLDFESQRRNRHTRFVTAMKLAITAQGINRTSYHVLGFARWVFGTTGNGERYYELRYDDICDELWLERDAAMGVISRALETGIVIRRPVLSGGQRCPFEYSIDCHAVDSWLENSPSSRTDEPLSVKPTAPPGSESVKPTTKSVKPTTKSVKPTTYKETSSSSLIKSFAPIDSKGAAPPSTGAKVSEERIQDVEGIRDIANRIAKAIGEPGRLSEVDRRQALEVAVLVSGGQVCQDALEQALESLRPDVRNRGAWFRRCMINRCKNDGLDFHQLVASAVLPSELLEKHRKRSGRIMEENHAQSSREYV